MTREEAVVVLQGYLDNPLINNKEPFNMAISAISEQRTGHWIECEDEVKCFCSECKEISDYPTKFCPNCGAKMAQESEGIE